MIKNIDPLDPLELPTSSLDRVEISTREVIKDKRLTLSQTNYHSYTFNTNEAFLV